MKRDQHSEGEEEVRARRSLHASVSFGGMVRVDGDLDPESGETLLTALGSVLDAEARSRLPRRRPHPAQRRADALTQICRQWVHDRGRFGLALEDGRPVFRRPDGSILDARAPP